MFTFQHMNQYGAERKFFRSKKQRQNEQFRNSPVASINKYNMCMHYALCNNYRYWKPSLPYINCLLHTNTKMYWIYCQIAALNFMWNGVLLKSLCHNFACVPDKIIGFQAECRNAIRCEKSIYLRICFRHKQFNVVRMSCKDCIWIRKLVG